MAASKTAATPRRDDPDAIKRQIELNELRAHDIETQARLIEARIRFAESTAKWREIQKANDLVKQPSK